jgi:hypothetical protein
MDTAIMESKKGLRKEKQYTSNGLFLLGTAYEIEHDEHIIHWDDYQSCEIPPKQVRGKLCAH